MRLRTIVSMALLGLVTSLLPATANAGTRITDLVWANDLIYDTIITPATFKDPPEQSTDILYSFMMSGLDGQRPVSDAAPGDPDYNGGRWSVKMVVFTEAGLAAHDPDGDGFVNFELKNAEQLLFHAAVLKHFEIFDTDIFFVCPLIGKGE